jgi:hypothetical protein
MMPSDADPPVVAPPDTGPPTVEPPVVEPRVVELPAVEPVSVAPPADEGIELPDEGPAAPVPGAAATAVATLLTMLRCPSAPRLVPGEARLA